MVRQLGLMTSSMDPRPGWTSVHWGYGLGLAVCSRCWALVLPEDTANHDAWHESLETTDG